MIITPENKIISEVNHSGITLIIPLLPSHCHFSSEWLLLCAFKAIWRINCAFFIPLKPDGQDKMLLPSHNSSDFLMILP